MFRHGSVIRLVRNIETNGPPTLGDEAGGPSETSAKEVNRQWLPVAQFNAMVTLKASMRDPKKYYPGVKRTFQLYV